MSVRQLSHNSAIISSLIQVIMLYTYSIVSFSQSDRMHTRGMKKFYFAFHMFQSDFIQDYLDDDVHCKLFFLGGGGGGGGSGGEFCLT